MGHIASASSAGRFISCEVLRPTATQKPAACWQRSRLEIAQVAAELPFSCATEAKGWHSVCVATTSVGTNDASSGLLVYEHTVCCWLLLSWRFRQLLCDGKGLLRCQLSLKNINQRRTARTPARQTCQQLSLVIVAVGSSRYIGRLLIVDM